MTKESFFSLLERAWLPVRTASGERLSIQPSSIPEPRGDPIIAFDWPRPDFDAASAELMIGLLSMTCWQRIVDEELWEEWWHEPPSPQDLDAAFGPFADAFVLDGQGPRFMQDLEELKGGQVGVDALLIDAPGANTKKLNKDLFVKRDQVKGMSRAAAAMALFTLQAFAPSGGAGHRTSLRGGGPVTTMVVPTAETSTPPLSLWHRLWLNVFWEEVWGDPTVHTADILPWCAPTRISEKKRTTAPLDVHPAQAYFGMPRRIRLDFDSGNPDQLCDLLGTEDKIVVKSFRMLKNGHNYEGWNRSHPLTPYYRVKAGAAEWLPSHPQPGHIGYRDWVGLVVADGREASETTRQPAQIVDVARRRLRDLRMPSAGRLRVAGFDMDNMKARGFVESEMPILLASGNLQERIDHLTRTMIAGAQVAEGVLSQTIGQAMSGGDLPDAKKGLRSLARQRFWLVTEPDFLGLIDTLPPRLDAVSGDDLDEVLRQVPKDWLGRLGSVCKGIFDELVPHHDLENRAIERFVRARRRLNYALSGYGKDGGRLFDALDLPLPESKKRSKAA